jgi:hypothetical protein
MTKMLDLLKSVAAIVDNYRLGEIAPIDADHVMRWISQFDCGVRKGMLAELAHVFGQTYFTKGGVEEFLAAVLRSKELVGEDPSEFWKSAKFLDIQAGGSSQRDMLELFGQALKKECGLEIGQCGQTPQRFVYLDDVLFTGNRIKNDLEAWIKSAAAPQTADVCVITIGLHAGGHYYADGGISAAAKTAGKTITLHWWHAVEIEDRKSMTNVSDVLRPTKIPADALTQAYVNSMKHAPVFRTPGKAATCLSKNFLPPPENLWAI